MRLPPLADISSAALFPMSERTSAMTTVAPFSASRTAVAFPIPPPAPVINATLPRRSTFIAPSPTDIHIPLSRSYRLVREIAISLLPYDPARVP